MSKSSNKYSSVLFLYKGYRFDKFFFVSGRLVEDSQLKPAKKSDGVWRNFVNSKKRFLAKGISGQKGQLIINEISYEVQTNEQGYFTLQIEKFHKKKKKRKKHLAGQFVFEDGRVVDFPEMLLNLNACGSLGVITDIDDTIIRSDVHQKKRTIARTLFKNVFKKKGIDGAANYLNEMIEQNNSPVFYCSRSPFEMYDVLNHFFELNNYPRPPMLLRNTAIANHYYQRDILTEQKFLSMKLLLENSGEIKFIMLGDSNEKDALIYLNLAKIFPDKIEKIYIRITRRNKKFEKLRNEIEQFSEKDRLSFFDSFEELFLG